MMENNTTSSAQPPQWLANATAALERLYPDDKFNIVLRQAIAVRCLDCPGKLYIPGPAESLANYEVHLKNRQHRQRVNDRLRINDNNGVARL